MRAKHVIAHKFYPLPKTPQGLDARLNNIDFFLHLELGTYSVQVLHWLWFNINI